MIDQAIHVGHELRDEDSIDFGTGFTVIQLREFMEQKGIPEDALIMYAGCGSHNVLFRWEATDLQREAILAEREEARQAEVERERKLREEWPDLA